MEVRFYRENTFSNSTFDSYHHYYHYCNFIISVTNTVCLHPCKHLCLHHFSYLLVKPCWLWAPKSLSLVHTEEFWLCLRRIQSLSSSGISVLHVDLEDRRQNRCFIEYRFLPWWASEQLHHSTHARVWKSAQPMNNFTGMMFSTKYRSHNNHRDPSCAHQKTSWLQQMHM